MTQLDALDKIHPDLISAFLTTGKCDGIPAEVQVFLKQLQWAAEIYEYERNITRAAKQLRQRINAQQHINVDERTCKARIYAAINYFNISNYRIFLEYPINEHIIPHLLIIVHVSLVL